MPLGGALALKIARGAARPGAPPLVVRDRWIAGRGPFPGLRWTLPTFLSETVSAPRVRGDAHGSPWLAVLPRAHLPTGVEWADGLAGPGRMRGRPGLAVPGHGGP